MENKKSGKMLLIVAGLLAIGMGVFSLLHAAASQMHGDTLNAAIGLLFMVVSFAAGGIGIKNRNTIGGEVLTNVCGPAVVAIVIWIVMFIIGLISRSFNISDILTELLLLMPLIMIIVGAVLNSKEN